jgi:integrase/recombinase XerD
MLSFEIEPQRLQRAAKVQGHGQAKALTVEELQRLFACFKCDRDRALFGICFFTGCRISEVLQLQVADLQDGLLSFRKSTVKGKKGTRQVGVQTELQRVIDEYLRSAELKSEGFLFPGKMPASHVTRQTAHNVLKLACEAAGVQGVSTHSFRRSFITQLRGKGFSPAQIQSITGHRRRESLMHYFDEIH